MFEYIKNRISKNNWNDEQVLKAYPEINTEILTQIKNEVSNDASGTSIPSTPAPAGN